MRVVSLVPSWTETLLAAGVDVVGRTRYCIHGGRVMSAIPVVGGTKDWDLAKIEALKPDLLILDQEENPKFMAEQPSLRTLATHVTAAHDLPQALRDLNQALQAPKLLEFALRWEEVLRVPHSPWTREKELPALIEWGLRPAQPVKRVIYMIWQNPWMCASRPTFIGSILEYLGFSKLLMDFDQKYPQLELNSIEPGSTLILFSSEPYPFLRKKSELLSLGFPHAFVNGESYSWFGLRSLEFLESQR